MAIPFTTRRRTAAPADGADPATDQRNRDHAIAGADAATASVLSAPRKKLVPLDDVPAFARLASAARVLASGRQQRQDQIDLMMIEAELARPATSEKGPRVETLKELAKQKRQAIPAAAAPPPDPSGLPEAVARALALLAGAAVEAEPDRAERLKKLRAEIATLKRAESAVAALLDDVRSEQSLIVARQLEGQHKQILKTIADAATALSAAIDAETRLYAAPLALGYDGRPDILNRPALDGAARLGSLTTFDSQISAFLRRMAELGVLT